MDVLRLKYEIKKNKMTTEEFCKSIGISKTAFYRKCNGTSDFTRKEIQKIKELLNLDSPDEIFFAKEVS